MPDSEHKQASLTLLAEEGSDQRHWDLRGRKTIKLGRIDDNDIVLPYSWVSRKHAMIQVESSGRFLLIDLGSANGTFVNGRRVHTPTPLADGDCIGIGSTRLLFKQAENAVRPPLPPAAGDNDEMTVAFVQKESITVLISDIHDYTGLSEHLGPRKISRLLQHWTGGVGKLVESHGGTVDKFIGDAVMALWGGADLRGNVTKALQTALAINRFTSQLHDKLPELSLPPQTGAAINSGEVMRGNLGRNGQQNYTVAGDAINLVFRLEALTDASAGVDLVLGESAGRHLKSPSRFFTQRSFSVKGRREPVSAWFGSFADVAACLKQD